jgi:transaldolase/glucose-6-phosphate isomerase
MTTSIQYRSRGQAVWLDSISSRMIRSGRLGGLIGSGTVYGVTSNPTIFGQAIQKNEGDYNGSLIRLADEGKSAFEIYDELTRVDIAEGADLFRPVFQRNGLDGWISLEVLPALAHDVDATVKEAQRLVSLLGRPNVFIKVPSTDAGLMAIRKLIGQGISINVTLMFNRRHYREVAEAYICGLEDFRKTGGDLSKVQSVASFFVSRVDTLVDKLLDDKAATASPATRSALASLKGKAGLANCKVVYQDFLSAFGTRRFQDLAAQGARFQRPLWASTGTKNPEYSDLLYVENLIAPDSVNTMPEKTLDALLDHGKCQGDTIFEGVDDAIRTLATLANEGLDVEALGEKLQVDGVGLFAKAYDELLQTIEDRRNEAIQNYSKTKKISIGPGGQILDN